jgi:hypothetical protein
MPAFTGLKKLRTESVDNFVNSLWEDAVNPHQDRANLSLMSFSPLIF